MTPEALYVAFEWNGGAPPVAIDRPMGSGHRIGFQLPFDDGLEPQTFRVESGGADVQARETLGKQAREEYPVVGILLDQVDESLLGYLYGPAFSLGDDRRRALVGKEEGHLADEHVVRGEEGNVFVAGKHQEAARDDVVQIIGGFSFADNDFPVLEGDFLLCAENEGHYV